MCSLLGLPPKKIVYLLHTNSKKLLSMYTVEVTKLTLLQQKIHYFPTMPKKMEEATHEYKRD